MGKKNNISIQFLEGFFDRMSDVIRYSGTKVLNKENLAEHSYYVSVLADGIAEDIEQKFDISIDRYKVLKYALYHDIEEIFTGDLVTPVKYKSKDPRIKFEEVWNQILKEELQSHFSENAHIAEMIIKAHNEYDEKKDEVLENQIVKFADILQALSYTMSELHLGNTYLKDISHNLLVSLEKRYKDNKYFSWYVVEILDFVKGNLK